MRVIRAPKKPGPYNVKAFLFLAGAFLMALAAHDGLLLLIAHLPK